MAALPLKTAGNWYRSDLNQHIQVSCNSLQTSPGPSSGTAFSVTPPSNAIWSWAEKSVFFRALSRHSRWQPDLIARDVGSKTEAEVIWFLQQLVRDEARFRLKYKATGQKRSHLHGFAPAAYEMSDKWVEQEGAMANSLDEAERNRARADRLLRQEKEVEGALAVRKVNRDPSKTYTAKELKFQERRARAERSQACVALVKQQMRTEWLEEMTAARLNVVSELLEAHWKPPSEFEAAPLAFTDLPTGDVRELRIAEDARTLKTLREIPNRTAEQQAEFRRLSEGARKRTAARSKKLLDIGHTKREIEEAGGVDAVYCRMQREDRIERGVLCDTSTQDIPTQEESSTPAPRSPSKREQRANHFTQITDNMTRAHKAAYLRATERERDDLRAWLQSEQFTDGLLNGADVPKVKALSPWLPEAKAARAKRLGKGREMGLETKMIEEKFELLNFPALARALSVPGEDSGLPSRLSFGLISTLTAFLEAFIARLVFEVVEFTEARQAVLGESSEEVDDIDVEETIGRLGLQAGLDWQELEPKWTSQIRRKKVGDAMEIPTASPNPASPDPADVMGVFPFTLPLVTRPYTSEDLDVLAEDPVQSILADDDHADVEDVQEAYDVVLSKAYEEALWEALEADEEAPDVTLQVEDRLQVAEETRKQDTHAEQDERQQLYFDLLAHRRDYERACTEWDRSENRRQNKLRKRAASEKLGLYDTKQAGNKKKKRRLDGDVEMIQMIDGGLLDSSDDEDVVQSRGSTTSETISSASSDVVDD